MSVTIYTHKIGLKHDTGPGHPERPDRLQALLDLFESETFKTFPIETARPADWEDILRVHEERYISLLQESIPDEGLAYAGSETVVSPGSWEAAERAAGAVCQAVDNTIAGTHNHAFCAVRPPGHHAFAGHGEGFCLLNNVCIGAFRALDVHKLEKVAILDFDVHHGNGTDSIARPDDRIFYASTHQWPLYPGTGLPETDIEGRIYNRTLAAGQGGPAFRELWRPLLDNLAAFRPDLIMISAGFDAHRNDPLAQISLEDEDFYWITEEVVKTAARVCDGKVISVLEGGYNLEALKSGVSAHLRALNT